MFNRITKAIQSRLQYWLGIPVLFVELDRLTRRLARLENKTRQDRRPLRPRLAAVRATGPERYDQVNRRKKRQRKGAR